MEELTTEPIAALPNPSYIARAANRLRKSSRPKDSTDLEFELNEECLPENFLRADVRAGSKRHLVFATDGQLQQLVRAKTWYLDGTFKLARQPHSIHTALLSKCIRAVWCVHEAVASCICPDVWQEKEILQEGKKNSYRQIYL